MMKQIFKLYFSSGWLPALLFLVLFGGFTAAAVVPRRFAVMVADGLFCLVIPAFFGIMAAALWNLLKRRWVRGLVNAFLLVGCGATAFYVMGFLMFASMFGASEDGFADHLEIPDGIEISEPGEAPDPQPGAAPDAFQAALLAALKIPGSADAAVTGSIPALVRLQEHRDALLRYLASSPAWRVFEEHGNVFATRRWMIGSEWQYDLHGYYSLHNIDRWSKSGMPYFQSRVTIGLSGRPWWRGGPASTRLTDGETKTVGLLSGNGMLGSHCILTAGAVVVELFEQSDAAERRLTKAALAFLEGELQPLADHPARETVRQLLPPGSVREGSPSFEIRNSFQPGIYDSFIWINSGEPGMLYLKAFEVTKSTALSVERLKERSCEWVGWSENPEELFFSNTHFTIYEGDWGKPYAARLEIWFRPDSGEPDRKLMEKVFKIEGWQR